MRDGEGRWESEREETTDGARPRAISQTGKLKPSDSEVSLTFDLCLVFNELNEVYQENLILILSSLQVHSRT